MVLQGCLSASLRTLLEIHNISMPVSVTGPTTRPELSLERFVNLRALTVMGVNSARAASCLPAVPAGLRALTLDVRRSGKPRCEGTGSLQSSDRSEITASSPCQVGSMIP